MSETAPASVETAPVSVNYLLAMRGIRKSFGKTQAVRHGEIQIRSGEIHALIGENGAGKSTLMNILCGVLEPDAGEIVFAGKPRHFATIAQAQSAGIIMIHQELNIVRDLTVAQNMYLGREPQRGCAIDDEKMSRDSAAVLASIGAEVSPAERLGDLTIAQQQMVEIAKALTQDIRLLILDEPTTALGTRDVELLFKVMRGLKAKGIAMIYISHRLNEILSITDRITVMRDGSYVSTLDTASANRETLVNLLVGRELKNSLKQRSEVAADAETVLEVRHLRAGPKVKDISFTLRRGEILGISGLMGAGRTELARAICGIDPVDAGEILRNGKLVKITSPEIAKQQGLCYLSEDRNRLGLLLDKSIVDNTVLSSIASYAHCGVLDDARMRQDAEQFNRVVKSKYSSLDEPIRNLSGGNRQKVIIARWLINDLDVMIFDEPTKGIDVGAKDEIYAIIRSLVARGKSVIIISSELQELQAVCDRILVLCEGRQTGELDIGEATQEKLMHLAIQRG